MLATSQLYGIQYTHTQVGSYVQLYMYRLATSQWHILVLDSEDLAMELWDLIEAVPVDDGVDQQEPLSRVHVLLSHGTELLQENSSDLLINS